MPKDAKEQSALFVPQKKIVPTPLVTKNNILSPLSFSRGTRDWMCLRSGFVFSPPLFAQSQHFFCLFTTTLLSHTMLQLFLFFAQPFDLFPSLPPTFSTKKHRPARARLGRRTRPCVFFTQVIANLVLTSNPHTQMCFSFCWVPCVNHDSFEKELPPHTPHTHVTTGVTRADFVRAVCVEACSAHITL
jgi:hypothetical protein